MAVTTSYSTEYTAINTTKTVPFPEQAGAKLRVAYFKHTQSGAGDATSKVYAVKLPAGRVTVHGKLCNLYVNWTQASATMDVGWAAYKAMSDGSDVAASYAGMDDGLDVDAAGVKNICSALTSTGYTKVFESKFGVDLVLTSQDVALADASSVSGCIVYSID